MEWHGRRETYFTLGTLSPILANMILYTEPREDILQTLPDKHYIPCNLSRCSFRTHEHPDSPIHMFVVYFCGHREDDAFYDLCGAFDIPDDVRVKMKTNNSSLKIRCFDVLHWVYHDHNDHLTLAMIKTKLIESNDQLQQIISDYPEK